MLEYSSAWPEALTESHNLVTKAEVLRNGLVVQELIPISGNVQVSITQASRRRANCTLIDPDGDLTPRTAKSLLAPLGNELRLYRGVRLPDGTPEIKPLTTVGISKTRITDSGEVLAITVEGYDRSRRIRRSKWIDPFVIAKDTNYIDAIMNTVSNRLPSASFIATPTNHKTPQLILGLEENHDPWQLITKMAISIGYEVFFDAIGNCVIQPVPSPQIASDVVWRYRENQANILSIDRELSDEFVYNHVVVTGESSTGGLPVRGEAMDNDPASPTYWLGDYGDVIYTFYSRFIRTKSQAEEAARAILIRLLGTTEKLQMPIIVNTAHQEGDLVQIERDKSGINDYYIFDDFNFPLDLTGAMNVTTRVKRGLLAE